MNYIVEYLDSFHSPQVNFGSDMEAVMAELHDLLENGKSVSVLVIESETGGRED